MKRELAVPHDTRQILFTIFRSIWIHSPTSFSVPADVPTPSDSHIQTVSPEQRQRLVLSLRDTLYTHCYARPISGPTVTTQPQSSPAPDPDLIRRLSAANHGRDAWLTGWCVQEVGSNGTIVITRDRWRRIAQVGEYAMTFSEDLQPRVGCGVTFCHRKESLTLQEGVYCAIGNVLPEPEDEINVLRIYFHASQESAVPIFDMMTTELNAMRVPFTLKCMTRDEDQDRSDATVLYLPASQYHRFAGLLSDLSVFPLACLKPGVPLFTKPLHTGIGLAESPSTGESFGIHRCRLVAEGIAAAWISGSQDAVARFRSTEHRFLSEGLSLTHPYLNPGSEDVYVLPAPKAPLAEPD